MNPLDRLTQNRVFTVLKRAEKLLADRKSTAQPVGTNNVKTYRTSGTSVVATLSTPTPQAPSVGAASHSYTLTQLLGEPLFARVCVVMSVNGVRYTPANRLADVKAGKIPYTLEVIRPVAGGSTFERVFRVFVTGPVNTSVTLEAQAVTLG